MSTGTENLGPKTSSENLMASSTEEQSPDSLFQDLDRKLSDITEELASNASSEYPNRRMSTDKENLNAINISEKLHRKLPPDDGALEKNLSTSDDTLESLLSHLGEFGKYQCIHILFFYLAALTAGMNMFALVPTLAVPEHRCMVPWLEEDQTLAWDSEGVVSAIPRQGDGTLSSCRIHSPGSNSTMVCSSWVFNTTYYTYTRAMQWDMVCDKSWMVVLAQSFYMSGVFVGCISCGALSDTYGRKTVYCWCALFQLIFGVGIAFVNEYTLFLASLFVYGFVGSGGAFVAAFVMVMELATVRKRTVVGVMFQSLFTAGIILVSFWASITSHAVVLQLIIGAHSLLLIGQYWWMDESPRWLWSQGRIAECVEVVAKGAKMNGRAEVDKAYYVSKGKAKIGLEEETSVGLSVLMGSPRLRAKTLIIAFAWGANCLAYYGLSLSTDNMEGNPFVNMFFMAAVEIPAFVVCVPLLDILGRRFLSSSLMLAGGALCLLTIFLHQDWTSAKAVLLFIGKFCVAGSSATIINFCAELMPTVARNTSIGLASTLGRLGALLTPAISLLNMFDKRLHVIVYSAFAVVAGFLMLFLPETLNQPLPQTVEDGEIFGAGDTAFANGCFPIRQKKDCDSAKLA